MLVYEVLANTNSSGCILNKNDKYSLTIGCHIVLHNTSAVGYITYASVVNSENNKEICYVRLFANSDYDFSVQVQRNIELTLSILLAREIVHYLKLKK